MPSIQTLIVFNQLLRCILLYVLTFSYVLLGVYKSLWNQSLNTLSSEKIDMTTWTDQDKDDARLQGWTVAEVWDRRVQLEIFKDDVSNIFLNDEAARTFVREKANKTSGRDALCFKAWSLVFRSKVSQPSKEKA
jgi:hypothetical protein